MTDELKERVKALAAEAGAAFDPGFESVGPNPMWIMSPSDLMLFAQAVARDCLQEDDALIEAMAEHTFGHTRADAIEWAKEDKFDSHCAQARELLAAMRPVVRTRYGLGD